MKHKLIVIASLLTIIFMTQNLVSQNVGYKQGNRDKVNLYLCERLNLTEEQTNQLEVLRLNHQKEMIDIRAGVEKIELDLKELKLAGNYSREEYLNKYSDILSAQNQLNLSRANHQMDVYQLLDENQKMEWNKMTNRFAEYRKHKIVRKMQNFYAE